MSVAGRRALALMAAGVVVVAASGCSGDDRTTVVSPGSTSTSASGPATSVADHRGKVPVTVARLAESIAGARRSGTSDLSGLSTPLIHVRADGKVELVVRSAEPVDEDRESQLRSLGAEVVGRSGAGAVQVWVPDDRIDAVAGLPWVVSISPPSYSRTGG